MALEKALTSLSRRIPVIDLHRQDHTTSIQPIREEMEFPTGHEGYELLEECGRGGSATVWRAVCKRNNKEVAVKILDLDSINCSLEHIIRETQLMRQLSHPHLLPMHASFVHQQNLWIVMPYVVGGSVASILTYAFNEGLEESVIATIMKAVLGGLDYIHAHNCIHRDIKAGNILIGEDGNVFLADFGVASSMERIGSWGDWQAGCNTLVGTPCWMAPEVIHEGQWYNTSADIWSFGITILELAHGHAPRSRLPPWVVMHRTLVDDPPADLNQGNRKFSKAMGDVIAKCLTKEPHQRPTAAQLRGHKFFKTAHDAKYLKKRLLDGLPGLEHRHTTHVTADRHKAAQQQEAYIKGVLSGEWNFGINFLGESALEAPTGPFPPATPGRSTDDAPDIDSSSTPVIPILVATPPYQDDSTTPHNPIAPAPLPSAPMQLVADSTLTPPTSSPACLPSLPADQRAALKYTQSKLKLLGIESVSCDDSRYTHSPFSSVSSAVAQPAADHLSKNSATAERKEDGRDVSSREEVTVSGCDKGVCGVGLEERRGDDAVPIVEWRQLMHVVSEVLQDMQATIAGAQESISALLPAVRAAEQGDMGRLYAVMAEHDRLTAKRQESQELRVQVGVLEEENRSLMDETAELRRRLH